MKSYSKPVLYTEEIIDINEPVAMGDSWLGSDCWQGICTAILDDNGSYNIVRSADGNSARITVQVNLEHDADNFGGCDGHHAYAQYLIFNLPLGATWTAFGRQVGADINSTPLQMNGNLGRVLGHYHANHVENPGTGALFLYVTDVAGYTDQELINLCAMDVYVYDDLWRAAADDHDAICQTHPHW